MERPLHPLGYVVATLVALGVLLSASVLLPHDRYYRFQAHDNISTRKSDWIYERLHFDQTPIDVALIGTSRTIGGLSGPLIEKEYCKATGRQIHLANLAIPLTGRNMHYVIAREAAQAKAPALTIVELNDNESRKPHRGFIFLANARDVISAPVAINANYLSDLLRLPGRQFSLFIQTVLQRPAVRRSFDPADYAGPNLDLTENQLAIDGRIKSRRIEHSRGTMNAMRAERLNAMSPMHVLPEPFRALEYRMSRVYFERIENATSKAGGQTTYAYLPAYGEGDIQPGLLQSLGVSETLFMPTPALANNPAWWLDATHLNAEGATRASKEFAAALATQFPELGVAGGCR